MNKYIIALLLMCFQLQIVSSQNFKFGKVSKKELEETSHPEEKDANAAILYRKLKTTFDFTNEQGFTGNIERRERIKIYNKDDNEWTTVSVFLYKGENNKDEVLKGLKAYTYNYDGSIEKIKLTKKEIFEEEVSDTYTKVTFTMPNIKNGSIIEYEYNIKTPYINTFDKFYFQESIPVNKVEMSFEAPEYLEYKTHRNGWFPFDVKETSRKRTLDLTYREEASAGNAVNRSLKTQKGNIELTELISLVTLDNVPSLKKEPYSGNINNYRSTLQFELSATRFPNADPKLYATTWEKVVKRIYDSPSFGGQLNRKGYFKDDVDQLIKGLSKKEAALRIYDYVKSQMTWNGKYGIYVNNSLASAYKNRKGNLAEINLLLVAMLKYAGIDTSPVILGTKSNGIFLFPTRSGFNAVIASVTIDDKLMLLDASDKMSSPNVLNSELLNWFGGRLINDNGVSKEVSLLPKQASHDALVKVNIDKEGVPMITSHSRYTNNKAYNMREDLFGKNNEEMSKVISSSIKDSEISNLEVGELTDVYKPLKVSFETDGEDYFETIGDKIYITPLLFYTTETNVFKAEKRTLPIDYDYERLSRLSFNITIPEGYKLESMPEPISASLPGNIGYYKYLVSHNVNGITVSVQRSIQKPFFSAESYGDLKSFYEMIVAKEAEKIVLSKI